jgi:riboflavin synthase
VFTGIIEEIGRIASVQRRGTTTTLTVSAKLVTEGTKIGDSISVSGACLTVTSKTDSTLTFDAVAETLRRTTLADARPGRAVNLERAVSVGGRFGGHFVQGHVDGIGVLASVVPEGDSHLMSFAVDREIARFLVEKGSVAVDGVSLTVAKLQEHTPETQPLFTVAVIPHTWENTTLGMLKPGDRVNIEVDIIGKYVIRFLEAFRTHGISEEFLRSAGFA